MSTKVTLRLLINLLKNYYIILSHIYHLGITHFLVSPAQVFLLLYIPNKKTNTYICIKKLLGKYFTFGVSQNIVSRCANCVNLAQNSSIQS